MFYHRVRSFFPGTRYELGLDDQFLQGVARLDLFQVIDLSWSLAELIAMAERRWSHASKKMSRHPNKLSPSLGFSPIVNHVAREKLSSSETESQETALRRFQHYMFGASGRVGRERDRDQESFSENSDSDALVLAYDEQGHDVRRQAILHLLNQIRTPREMLAVLDRSIICAASIHDSKQVTHCGGPEVQWVVELLVDARTEKLLWFRMIGV
ncbi:hypothetical protein GUITHDRAFT_115509 [Guillardia theta CCMP2712]|uniref:Uncharacterized protein n=1 Tax=Guillardia theta (strain CCMP2712) TaxID=905079 RepID=L1IQM4_GUITC|nr:hypothetical protein GUITHDRAFT_115509 [Guillardia theta CCMP2712]EKX38367.1 hypothetical protein GUITHDRAFT_115509 [Guillardia theta CCMP2712]|eukprot:XP_005825347.1 hypothetical protein GUITHDRAFT_115509 [Guillardia theta CCMP2712]